MRLHKLSGDIGLLVGGLGAGQAIYLAFQAHIERHKNNRNILLSLFFLFISIRILKSLIWVNWSLTPDWLINIGFIAHSATGPLLLLYSYQFIYDKKISKMFVHFIPTFLLLGLITSANLENFWYVGGYSVLLYHQLIYAISGLFFAGYGCAYPNCSSSLLSRKDWIWIWILTFSTLLLQLAYFSNYILGFTPYILAPIVYGIFVYCLSFFALRNPEVFRPFKDAGKYSNINLSNQEIVTYRGRIIEFMKINKPYLNSDFTIKDLANGINLPSYLVSHIINSEFSQNFPDYINCFRINHAKQLLAMDANQYLKISSIAYDSGFNSLSSFNLSFKKYCGMTPSQYRRTLVNS